VHLYGHGWPVRWGDEGELKMVKVYSNCEQAELFVNGKSYGVKKRNSQDFPAAGLRWNVPFTSGDNQVRVVARQGKQTVQDELRFKYQTQKWGKPTRLTLQKISEANGLTTVEAKLYDAQGVQCLDAVNWVDFSLAGAGKLLDDLGTSTGSRKVQAYNGRAIIRLQAQPGKTAVAVQSPGLETVLLTL
jgi:beta-galactosidase